MISPPKKVHNFFLFSPRLVSQVTCSIFLLVGWFKAWRKACWGLKRFHLTETWKVFNSGLFMSIVGQFCLTDVGKIFLADLIIGPPMTWEFRNLKQLSYFMVHIRIYIYMYKWLDIYIYVYIYILISKYLLFLRWLIIPVLTMKSAGKRPRFDHWWLPGDSGETCETVFNIAWDQVLPMQNRGLPS